MVYVTTYNSPLGNITMASDGESLTGLWFEGQKHYLGKIKDDVINKSDLLIFAQTKSWLREYFSGKRPELNQLKLRLDGTFFQKKVWDELLKIPYGETTTYGDIAKRLNVNSGQAVGGAVGRNPVSLIIPCHRVIGKDGSLTGYAGGIDKKKFLLDFEKFGN